MDALELLTQQHREVDNLFASLEDGDDATRAVIIQKLTKHAELEETYFYPALQKKHQTAAYVPHAQTEHMEVKGLIAEWRDCEIDEFMPIADELKEAVEHHVKEEEGEMFDAVRQAFDEEELKELGKLMASK